jgi:hypothetical protein
MPKGAQVLEAGALQDLERAVARTQGGPGPGAARCIAVAVPGLG